MTRFCDTAVEIGGHVLTIDGNTKISGWPEPTPNSFSLPAPSCCPGSTSVCRSTCYASHDGSKLPQELRDLYDANERALRAILAQPDAGFIGAMQLARWIAEHCQAVGFRWHVSGDVFSDQHAWWIVSVATASPEVQHWIYTRSLARVPTLVLAHNLAVNVSADRENYRDAARVAHECDARLTYLWQGEELPDLPLGSVIFPDYPVRSRESVAWADLPTAQRRMFCAADLFGQNEHYRCGVCTKCGNPTHGGQL